MTRKRNGGKTTPTKPSSRRANRAAMGRRVAFLSDQHLPPIPEAYDAIDQMVLFNDRFAEDPVSLNAIRSWLNDGGRVWLQLDLMELESAAQLLGERLACEVIDRVELHEIEVKSTRPRPGIGYTGERDFEDPVAMVRVAVDKANVTHVVDGWPAAFMLEYGRGRVFVTTVGGPAWVVPGRHPRDYNRQGNFDATNQLGDIGIMSGRTPSPAPPDGLDDYLNEQIGYQIVGRGPVVATLGFFCVGLAVVGGVLARRKQLEKMAIVAPLFAVVAATPLVVFGTRSQQSAPPTVAMGQFVEIGDSSNRAAVTGSLAMYSPEPATTSFGADGGGVFEPDFRGLESTIRRMVWTDLDRWRWDDVRLTAGVRKAEIRSDLILPEAVEARGTFDSEGFRGVLQGLQMEDSLIVAPGAPPLAVNWSDNEFQSGPADQMAPGQYVSGAILSGKQRRRQAVYQTVLESYSRPHRFPTRRLLMGWTDPFDLNFKFAEGTRIIGGALVAAPLSIERPKAGSEVLIPVSFVGLQSTAGPSGPPGGSPLYNTRTGQWIRSESATKTWLRCLPPPELAPLTLKSAVIRMKATIPSRTLTLLGAADGKVVELMKRPNVVGPFELTIDDPSVLKIDDAGGIALGVWISESEGGELQEDPQFDPTQGIEGQDDNVIDGDKQGVQWEIDYLYVELKASVE